MICKNPYCKWKSFIAVVELDTGSLIGIKCANCGARYSLDDIDINKDLERIGWCSMKWGTIHL